MMRYWFLPLVVMSCNVQAIIEIDGSAFSTNDAPIPRHINARNEKVIVIDPKTHTYGAYRPDGHLLRWGIASAGRDICYDTGEHCRTKSGTYRIYSLGNESCYSHKYNSASMPYCMYFNGSEALHGSDSVEFGNISHGCVRVHVDDAKWLRYHFVEGPSQQNRYQGTLVIIKSY